MAGRFRRAVLHPLTVSTPIVAGAAILAVLAATGSGGGRSTETVLALLAFGWAGLNAGWANSGST